MKQHQLIVGVVLLLTACGGGSGSVSTPGPAAATTSAAHAVSPPASDGGYQFLAEQKANGERVTSRAADLINENRMAEVKTVYEDRWKELTRLRVKIAQDDTLSEDAKANIDRALKAEQEGITQILDTYEHLYG